MLSFLGGMMLLSAWLELREARLDLEARRGRIEETWAVVETDLRARAALATDLLASVSDRGPKREVVAAGESVAGTLAALQAAGDRGSVVNANLAVERAIVRYAGTLNVAGTGASGGDLRRLQEEILAVEHRIALHRSAYNEAVQRYNIRRAIFPANFAAGLFKLERYPHYLPTDLKPPITLPAGPAEAGSAGKDAPIAERSATARAGRAGRR